MTQLTITTGTEEDFFARGRRLAQAADRGQAIAQERVVSFEDPADVVKLITATRLALFRAVKEAPGSITDIAARLHRDRSAVKRDLDELAQAGLVTIADRVLPGHGRMKEVRATASRFQLMAEVA
ncbi:MAG: MarR family transcriptional regulator [Comamonadaceae bacterium]|jgi:predicted transcriptional regulator|nr:MarR family transcriptional regulator [Comamonadaceae bacterium]